MARTLVLMDELGALANRWDVSLENLTEVAATAAGRLVATSGAAH